jgi:renalase
MMFGGSKLDVLIVGAGLAGLMAAQTLQAAGKTAVVVEKSANVGGRLATRPLGPGIADYGAQFFTVRQPKFQKWVTAWQAEGLVFEWSRGWGAGLQADSADDGFPRYGVTGGMTAVAQHLAKTVNVHTQTELLKIQQVGNGWEGVAKDGRSYHSRALLLTPPVPQSLALLDAGSVPLTSSDRAALDKICYAPSLTGLFWIEGGVSLPPPGAVQQPEQIISWIADNQQKGISPDATILTTFANPTVSQLWYEAPKGELVGLFVEEIRPFLTKNSIIKAQHIHRWRYALPTVIHPQRSLLASKLPPLAFAGDAFNGPRVEGAVLSGITAVEKLIHST